VCQVRVEIAAASDPPNVGATTTPDAPPIDEGPNLHVTSSLQEEVSATDVVRVGYVGQRGTLADVAARTMFPLLQVGQSRTTTTCLEEVGFAHSVDAMDALVDKEIDYGILPTASLLTLRPDFMLAEFTTRPLTILGEFALTMDLCLCALPGTTMHECDCVMSDSTLLQTSEALILKLENDRGSPIVRQAAWDSAGACFIIRDQAAHGIAVLASKDAAHDAGLDVLADNLAGGGLGSSTVPNPGPPAMCVSPATVCLRSA